MCTNHAGDTWERIVRLPKYSKATLMCDYSIYRRDITISKGTLRWVIPTPAFRRVNEPRVLLLCVIAVCIAVLYTMHGKVQSMRRSSIMYAGRNVTFPYKNRLQTMQASN